MGKPLLALCLIAASPLRAQDISRNVQLPDVKGRLAAYAQAPNVPTPSPARLQLWSIASCLRDVSPPLQASPTSPAHACENLVFEASPDQDFLVMEDIHMTLCPLDAKVSETDPRGYPYFHALAIPFARVTGVEQVDALPPGIWNEAWRTAEAYVPETGDIVLVANSKKHRSQDQLHIHLVRLKPGAKDKILRPSGRGVPPAYIDSLSGSPDPVWAAAERNAGDLAAKLGLAPGLESALYGVAVVYDGERKQYAVAALYDFADKDFVVSCPGDGYHETVE